MYRLRMAYEILFILLIFFNVWIPSSAGKSGGLCISPGGRFHPFSSEGKSPRKVPRGLRDLALCRVFRQSTCCDVAQTYHAFELVRNLATSGEASRGCLHIWELLECSICDPRIGVQPGTPLICASFCDMILQDCSSAYFSIDPRNQVLSPCGLGDIICGRASEWASNGTELCRLAGFAVKQDVAGDHGADELYCYGGQASLKSISGSWKASRSGLSARDQSNAVLENFQQWFRKMPVQEKVRWAIGGMVLTSGLLYVSKRKSSRQRKMQAMVLRNARRMEATINHQSSIKRR